MGRPKIKWDSLTYDDYDFDQLDKIKNKQINKIKSLQKKIDKISLVIDQKSKIFTKKNNTITLINSEKSIRGKISYFGRTVWVHIGSKHKKGLVHKHTLIGSMTNDQLCDEFRYKAKIKIQSSWVLH